MRRPSLKQEVRALPKEAAARMYEFTEGVNADLFGLFVARALGAVSASMSEAFDGESEAEADLMRRILLDRLKEPPPGVTVQVVAAGQRVTVRVESVA